MKLLFISNIGGNKVGNFSKSSIMAAKELGIEFHIAANWSKSSQKQMKEDEESFGITLHHIDFERNPLNLKNYKAYKQLLSLMKEEQFDVIHCNTPIGGLLGRLCGKKEKVGKIIYTAHGFHFYKGAPLVKKAIFKYIERLLAHYTDVVITINQEDYTAAQSFKLRKGGKVYYVPGVGVDTKLFQIEGINKSSIKDSLGLKSDDIVLISMGDLIDRKNYVTSIEAIAKAGNPKLNLLICGRGPELDRLKRLARELKVEKQIHFLGFRSDVKELLNVADIFLFTTYQEGLPRSMMEAMSAGLPCIASKIRGNTDLLENREGGFLCKPDDIDGFAAAINTLANDESLRELMGQNNNRTIKMFDVKSVISGTRKIYESELF